MIIDTSVLISAIERRDAAAIAAIDSMEQLSVRSMVVLGELTFGLQTSSADSREIRQRTLDLYLAISDPGPLTSLDGASVALLFGSVSAVAKTENIKVGQNDRWLVAESLFHKAPVWTSDLAMEKLLLAVAQHFDLENPGKLI